MTRREAWLEARARLAESARVVISYQREGKTRVVIADREAGYIELELGPHDPFELIDRIGAFVAGKPWSREECAARFEATDKAYQKQRRQRELGLV